MLVDPTDSAYSESTPDMTFQYSYIYRSIYYCTKFSDLHYGINPLQPGVADLYPRKTPENVKV